MGLRLKVVRTQPAEERPALPRRVLSAVRAVPAMLPRGWTLSEESWRNRHRGILVVLWCHVVVVPVFGILRGYAPGHVLLETGGIAAFACLANTNILSRRVRMISASLGLLTASAVLVHLSQGSIEMHFHFFVMVPLIALYQDWVPFLVAILYVVLHHGLAGTLDPASVFNHPAASAQPWKWALIHAFFITGTSIVCLTTWRLLESALNRARAEAQVKSEFLSVLSHEIRTPLTAVIGYTGLLADGGLSAEQRDYANTIRRSSDHLLTLINDILDYSKLEAGRLELDDSPFDVLHLVDDTMGLVADTARKQGITLSSLCENSVPNTAVGDSGRISQILLNLVSNAVKFTETGEVFVRVTARPMGGERYELSVAVRDTGIGIEPEHLATLFDSFKQAEASISRRYGGTGLGLAIAKQLCELMSGKLSVESSVGKGSTFTATIVVKQATPDWKRHDVRQTFPDLSVMVVGHAQRAERLLQFVSQWGVTTRALSPSEALMRARSGQRCDVAFVFDELDDLDPLVFALDLRSQSVTAPQRVVLVSAIRPESSDVAFDSVLIDPLKQSHVYDLLVSMRTDTASTPEGSGNDPALAERLPLRILVAEDNHVNQKVIVAQLRGLGYDADAVSSGKEAVESLEVRAYDVVLMDVHMPQMDGISATRAIRERHNGNGPALIGVSADATTETRTACMAAGMDDYITKPVKASELAAVLMRNAASKRAS
jgi:signal transduction histidine kinase/ActR/RegA family two-component response regulator